MIFDPNRSTKWCNCRVACGGTGGVRCGPGHPRWQAAAGGAFGSLPGGVRGALFGS